ncbi:MAG TPA: histidine phosphatase family protein [Solirubrobacteraceae bacterium]|nr:histidine phosphatase family protein [Solirubrobacteraceae bacterium]
MADLFVVRHGETEWSLSGQHTGRTDLPLTDEGRTQARALRPVLHRCSFALVLASPLQRARETAALAGLSPVFSDDLLEWDYGSYEGRTAADIRAERPGWDIWRDGAEGGETPAEVAARAERVIARVLPALDQGDVCLVAHSHFLRMLATRWLEQEIDFGARLPMEPTAVGRLGLRRGIRVLHEWTAPPDRSRITRS